MTLRAGRYELLDTIASGGMATVHLGRAVGAGGFERLVAIKTMHPHLSSEPDFVGMFLDEARLAARIRHPNVVGTIDIQQDELGLLLVMEFVEGPSMSQVLRALNKKQSSLPLEIALRVILDALAGLHAAHELCGPTGEPLNVVHRDVSPQNILVGIDGIARITDFGVARAESRISSTKSGDAKGKISYMAPEQALHQEMDRRVDVYAAGLVMWEFLTGKRLLRGENDMVIMNMIFHGRHPAPHEVVASIPRELSEVVMRAISRERDERPPTAAAFAEALDKAASACGLSVANAKTVGAFVRELNLHKCANDIASASRPLATIPPPSMRTMPSAEAEARTVITAEGKNDEAKSNPGTESRGALATASSGTSPSTSSSRSKLVGGIGAVAIIGALSWFAVGAMSSQDKPHDLPATGAAKTPASVETAREPIAPPAPPPVAAPSASATPSVSASAMSTADAPKTKTPPTSAGGAKSPKTFIPKEL